MVVVKNKENEVEKNIPIEIVLQDPNDPIVPAPDPSDPTGGETVTAETNIAVQIPVLVQTQAPVAEIVFSLALQL